MCNLRLSIGPELFFRLCPLVQLAAQLKTMPNTAIIIIFRKLSFIFCSFLSICVIYLLTKVTKCSLAASVCKVTALSRRS